MTRRFISTTTKRPSCRSSGRWPASRRCPRSWRRRTPPSTRSRRSDPCRRLRRGGEPAKPQTAMPPMSDKPKILIQLDTDPQPSVFDRVVAVDAGADQVFSYGGVRPEAVRDLVHGAIFTRGSKDLRRTAFFVGGSDVAAGEQLLQEVLRHMQPQTGPRVSVMLDSNGANTTAAAAVRAVANHQALNAVHALVLAGTGPVGQRVALLLARQGADVRV